MGNRGIVLFHLKLINYVGDFDKIGIVSTPTPFKINWLIQVLKLM